MSYDEDEQDPGDQLWEPDSEMNSLTHAVIGAAIEVHRELGPGLDESLFREAMCIEMTLRRIPFQKELEVDVRYKGRVIGKRRLDFLIAGKLILELKAVEQITSLHKAQVNTYLKITGLHLGLLINFNTIVLKDGIRRIIRG